MTGVEGGAATHAEGISARRYGELIVPRIEFVVDTQGESITRAGALLAAAIAGGHRAWVSQTSHTLHLEATHRAGGLMAVHVLEDLRQVAPGDVVVVGTSAGTTAGVVDLAVGARQRGAAVISLSQIAFETDPRMTPEHPSGQVLHQVADIAVDLGGPFGDGEFELPGTDVRILPSSGATGVVAMWMIFAEAVAILVAAGVTPLVWQSNLLSGAVERNAALNADYERTRRGYVPTRTER